MAMKKFINKAEDLVPELVEGFVRANPNIVCMAAERLVARTTPKEQGKVGIVTMGGAGHEPALIGWVGKGLVDVCVLRRYLRRAGWATHSAGCQARRSWRGRSGAGSSITKATCWARIWRCRWPRSRASR